MKYLSFIPLFMVTCLPLVAAKTPSWQAKLQQELPLMGHRNWIVIVDSAYPLQTSPGVETIETGADQIAVIKTVLEQLSTSNHVRPIVYMDAELPFVSEKDAPGVTQYREHVKNAIGDAPIHSLLHERLIAELNKTGTAFHVLVLKTTLTVPYTSVFLQLNCKYWSDASEQKLREIMNETSTPPANDSGPSL